MVEIAAAALDHPRDVIGTIGVPALPFVDQRAVDIRYRVAADDAVPQIADRRRQRLELRDIELGERQRCQNDFRRSVRQWIGKCYAR